MSSIKQVKDRPSPSYQLAEGGDWSIARLAASRCGRAGNIICDEMARSPNKAGDGVVVRGIRTTTGSADGVERSRSELVPSLAKLGRAYLTRFTCFTLLGRKVEAKAKEGSLLSSRHRFSTDHDDVCHPRLQPSRRDLQSDGGDALLAMMWAHSFGTK